MDDFGMFARDLGFRPQGKSAPMKSSGVGSDRSPATSSSPFSDYQFGDAFGGPPEYPSSNNNNTSSVSDFDYDSIFKSSATNESKNKFNSASSVPVYDDDDIFDGLPGLKTKSVPASAKYDENVFASISSPSWKQSGGDQFDDLLGNLGRVEKAEPKENINKSSTDFDDLLPGFGSGSPSNRPNLESSQTRTPKPTGHANQTSKVMDDPFVVLESSRSTSTPGVSSPGFSNDPLEDIGKLSNLVNTMPDISSLSGGIFGDIDSLDGLSKSVPAHSSEKNSMGNSGSPSREGSSMRRAQDSAGSEAFGSSSFNYYSESQSQRTMPVDECQESHQTLFDMPTASNDSQKSFGQSTSSPSYVNANLNETNF